MNPPETYYEWSQALKALEDGADDEATVEAMRAGSLHWQEGVAPRFAKRLEKTVNVRLQRVMDKFDRILGKADQNALLTGISEVRKEFLFLKDIVTMDVFPKDISEPFEKHIVDFSQQVQSSMEDSAANDTTGKLLSTVRNNSVAVR